MTTDDSKEPLLLEVDTVLAVDSEVDVQVFSELVTLVIKSAELGLTLQLVSIGKTVVVAAADVTVVLGGAV